MTTLICDTETDNLRHAMTKLWCVQIGDADGNDSVVYGDREHCDAPLQDGLDRMRSASRVVFHNGIGHDWFVGEKFFPGVLARERMLDTLVMARLAQPQERDHSLDAWGKRTGVYKTAYRGGYDVWTPEFADYSRQDIQAGRALWNKVKHVLDWGEACELEHDVAWAIRAQEDNGFCFDIPAAEALDVELRAELDALNKQLQAAFPPIQRERRFTPKSSNSKMGYVKGVENVKTWMEVFNPASRVHVSERLMALGWKPKSFGADGVPNCDEPILAALIYPEAKLLLKRAVVAKRLAALSDGNGSYLKLVKSDGRIHGRVNPNGAVTGRMSHSKPNSANVDKDPRIRGLFKPRPGWKLVGADAAALEGRMQGHFLARYDNGAFIKAVTEGTSEGRTDIHSRNLEGLIRDNLVPPQVWDDPKLFKIGRNTTKNDFYGMVYGAQDPKLGLMLKIKYRELGVPAPKEPDKALGAKVRASLGRSMIGLPDLVLAVQTRAKTRKYIVGLDGRHIEVRSMHAALNTLFQSAGAIVMKKALQLFMRRYGDTHGVTWGLCAAVHDEQQFECAPEHAEEMGKAFVDCIIKAGEHFQLRCPLDGACAIGNSWAETH